jgi:NADPH:quinone reductase-like Zn-dependent oxidoreductase
MKAIVIHEFGGPDVLKLEDYPDPVARPGEVVMRVAAASINPIDIAQRAGLTKDFNPVALPGVLGWDVAGTIVSVGSGVTGFAVGDKVLAWAFHTYAELCAVKADLLAKVPQSLDLFAAAALPLVTITGNQLISIASGAKAGQRVLVSGALGSVGRSALFTARACGAMVIAGVRKVQLEEAKSLTADQVVAIDDDDDLAAMAPVDIVANTVRGRPAGRLLEKVKQGGTFASVTGAPENAASFPSVRVVPYVSRQNANTLRLMAEAVDSGRLVIPVDRRLPLRDAASGHAAVEKGVSGKVLLLP